MSSSIALSPRPNPPGPGANAKPLPHPKTRSLAAQTASPTLVSGTSTPDVESDQDLAAQLNEDVKNQYVIERKVGSGTYADVYVAHMRSNPSKMVAIKTIRQKPIQDWAGGISLDPLREIRFLLELSHPNILTLHAVYSQKSKISMVLEYLSQGDLEEVWRKHALPYTGADIKAWMLMLLRGVAWCHSNRILHRDIKSNNCLIGADGTLKLADFGLARPMSELGRGRRMTHEVVTRWYRPPELFYRALWYGAKVDIWSCGMIMAELAGRAFFCPGQTDMEQLALYCDIFGVPTEETWPGVTQLECYVPMGSQLGADGRQAAPRRGQPLSWWKARFGVLGDEGVELLRGMLAMDPRKRLGGDEVLAHRWWVENPKPTRKEDLPRRSDEEGMGRALKRGPGEIEREKEGGRGDKVARKLDFGGLLR